MKLPSLPFAIFTARRFKLPSGIFRLMAIIVNLGNRSKCPVHCITEEAEKPQKKLPHWAEEGFSAWNFVCGDEIIFNEVSPRPHDTGIVTWHLRGNSQFALHARAILVLPIRKFISRQLLKRLWLKEIG